MTDQNKELAPPPSVPPEPWWHDFEKVKQSATLAVGGLIVTSVALTNRHSEVVIHGALLALTSMVSFSLGRRSIRPEPPHPIPNGS